MRLIDTQRLNPIPPNTATPDVADEVADAIRFYLAQGRRDAVRTIDPVDFDATAPLSAPDREFHPVVWPIQRARGPAPYVGDWRDNQAVYEWLVAVAPDGRQVAGDSTLVWRYGL